MTIGALYEEFLKSSGICIDSRTAGKGELFFALRGENFNGNLYIDDALEKGCRHAVSDDPGMGDKVHVTVVTDVLTTLQELAHHHREQWGGKVLAITGSNGKTTTKELVTAVLSKKFKVLATKGNLNNHIGVPLTLLELTDQEVAIIEMGANHVGEIGMLCKLANPHAGIITNIGKAHLEGFGSVEGIRQAKGELFDHLEKNDGTAIVDMSDPVLAEMARARSVHHYTYGQGEGYDVSGSITQSRGDAGIDVTFSIQDKQHGVHSALFGAYNLKNILAAAAAGGWLEVDPGDIAEALESYLPDNNRSQMAKGRSNTLVLDAYNANPTSMEGALAAFGQMDHKGKWVILGDMHELGEDEREEHEVLLRNLADSDISYVLLVGERFGQFSNDPAYPFHFFENIGACLDWLKDNPPRDALIMLKGSRKNALEKATNFLLDC